MERAQFSNIAYCSGLETINHLNGAYDLGLIADDTLTAMRFALDKILSLLSQLYTSQLNQKENLKDRLKHP